MSLLENASNDFGKSAEQILEKCHRDIAPHFTMWPPGGHTARECTLRNMSMYFQSNENYLFSERLHIN